MTNPTGDCWFDKTKNNLEDLDDKRETVKARGAAVDIVDDQVVSIHVFHVSILRKNIYTCKD